VFGLPLIRTIDLKTLKILEVLEALLHNSVESEQMR
jgi:hypothetical protein